MQGDKVNNIIAKELEKTQYWLREAEGILKLITIDSNPAHLLKLVEEYNKKTQKERGRK